MNEAPDCFVTWDAAYVLGALAPVEQRAYEEHLAGCPSCHAGVRELAALPGLLTLVPPEEVALLTTLPGPEMLEDSPPPDQLARVRRRLVHLNRRTRRQS